MHLIAFWSRRVIRHFAATADGTITNTITSTTTNPASPMATSHGYIWQHLPPYCLTRRRFDSPGPRLVSIFFAAPAFVAAASATRHDTIEIFLFASLNPKPLLLRDARARGRVTAFTVDAAGRKSLLFRYLFVGDALKYSLAIRHTLFCFNRGTHLRVEYWNQNQRVVLQSRITRRSRRHH